MLYAWNNNPTGLNFYKFKKLIDHVDGTREVEWTDFVECASDKILLKLHADKYVQYPLPFGESSFLVACPALGEYISSSSFSADTSQIDVLMAGGDMLHALMLLFSVPSRYRRHHDLIGRWYNKNCAVFTCGDQQGYAFAVRCWQDISKQILPQLDSLYAVKTRQPTAENFRQMIFRRACPQYDDFTWLTVEDVQLLRHDCLRRRRGFWLKFREWLLQQRLSPAVIKFLTANEEPMNDEDIQQRRYRHIRSVKPGMKCTAE